MLSDAGVLTTLPVSDLERAKRFYHEMLGLRPLQELPQGVLYECAEGEIEDLKSDGVSFEEYDLQDLTTVWSIAYTRSAESAWFRDSEGNLIGLTQSTLEDK